jgi:hypothetical protein
MKSTGLISIFLVVTVDAFTVSMPSYLHGRRIGASKTVCEASVSASAETIASIGYTVSVNKPLGVVFGENRGPFFGLVIDDVEAGQNGGKAGLRVGDQLLAIDGNPVIGNDFDSAMTLLKESPDPLELDLYRGNVNQLYTILMNQQELGGDAIEEEDDEEIIMDDSYESPVQIDVSQYEDQSLSESAGDVVKNVGKFFGGGDDKKEKKGLFGGMFSKETIQLEGDDGTGK